MLYFPIVMPSRQSVTHTTCAKTTTTNVSKVPRVVVASSPSSIYHKPTPSASASSETESESESESAERHHSHQKIQDPLQRTPLHLALWQYFCEMPMLKNSSLRFRPTPGPGWRRMQKKKEEEAECVWPGKGKWQRKEWMFYLWNKRNFKMGKYLCEGVHRTQVKYTRSEYLLYYEAENGATSGYIVSCMAAEE